MDNYSASLGIFILSMIELCISPVSSAAVNTLKRIEMGNMEYHLTRCRVIKNTELMGIAGAMSQLTGLSQTTQTKKAGLLAAGNSKPGTLEWQLQYTRLFPMIGQAGFIWVNFHSMRHLVSKVM